MRNIRPGRRNPPDTKKYAEMSCYRLFISKEEKCIMLHPTDYHPGIVYFHPLSCRFFARSALTRYAS